MTLTKSKDYFYKLKEYFIKPRQHFIVGLIKTNVEVNFRLLTFRWNACYEAICNTKNTTYVHAFLALSSAGFDAADSPDCQINIMRVTLVVPLWLFARRRLGRELRPVQLAHFRLIKSI